MTSENTYKNILLEKIDGDEPEWYTRFRLIFKKEYYEGLAYATQWMISNYSYLDHTAVQTNYAQFEKLYDKLIKANEISNIKSEVILTKSDLVDLQTTCIWFGVGIKCSGEEAEQAFTACEELSDTLYDHDI